MPDEPTFRDMTAADVDLFLADARKPPHSIETCQTADCWACTFERRMQRLAEDSRDEREHDREAS